MEVIQATIIISQPPHTLPISRKGRRCPKLGLDRVSFPPIRGYRGNLTASVPELPSSPESNAESNSVGKDSPALFLRRPVKRPKTQLQLDWQEGAWVRELVQGRPDSEKAGEEADIDRSEGGGEPDVQPPGSDGNGGTRDTSTPHQKSDDYRSQMHSLEDAEESRLARAEWQRKVSSFIEVAKVQPKTLLTEDVEVSAEKGDSAKSESLDDAEIEALFPAGGTRFGVGGMGESRPFVELWADEASPRAEKNILRNLEPGSFVDSLFEDGELESSTTRRGEEAGEGDVPSVSKSSEDKAEASNQVSKRLPDKVADDNVSQALYEWAEKVVQTLPQSAHIVKRKMNVQELVGLLARVSDEAGIAAELSKYQAENGGLSELTSSMVVVELCRTGRAKIALQVLDWLSKAGIQLRLTSYNSLLAGLVRASCFEEAYDVFEKMKSEDVKPSVYSYTLLMQVAARTKGYKATLRVFNEMVKDGRCKPDVFSFNCLISAFGRAHKWKEVAQIWEKMKQDGCKEGMGTYCLLVSTFVRCNQVHLALEVYHSIIQRAWKPNKDILKALICSCAKEGRWMLALDFLEEMLVSGIKPSATVLNSVLSSVAKSGEVNLTFRGYECMRALGLKPDPYTWCSLLTALNCSGEYDRAWKLFESMKDMDVKPTCEVYSSMLAICLKVENWQTALRLVWEMEKEGLKPDVQVYTLLINTCEAAGQAQVALEVYEHMLQIRVAPNCFTYASLIRACGKVFNWHKARELFQELREAGLAPNIYVYNALYHAFIKSGQVNYARKLYWEMLDHGCNPDTVTRDLFAKHPVLAGLIK